MSGPPGVQKMGGIPNMLPTKIPSRGHISSRFDDTSVSSASCGPTQETSAESKSRCFHGFWAKTRSSSNETLQLLAERISSWRRHPHVLLFLGCSSNYEFCRGAAVKRLSESIQDSKMQYLHFRHVLHCHCLECYSGRARWELRGKPSAAMGYPTSMVERQVRFWHSAHAKYIAWTAYLIWGGPNKICFFCRKNYGKGFDEANMLWC